LLLLLLLMLPHPPLLLLLPAEGTLHRVGVCHHTASPTQAVSKRMYRPCRCWLWGQPGLLRLLLLLLLLLLFVLLVPQAAIPRRCCCCCCCCICLVAAVARQPSLAVSAAVREAHAG
jgi:hypothetical protein